MVIPDGWDWGSLESMGGDVARVRDRLEVILEGESSVRKKAWSVLYCEVANQGQLYSAAAACVDAIARHAERGGSLTPESLNLLESILSARTPGLSVRTGGRLVDVSEYYRMRILDILPILLQGVDDSDLEYFREVCFLIPQLADSSGSVVEFLSRAVEKREGESLRFAREALEEAEEVLVEGHMP